MTIRHKTLSVEQDGVELDYHEEVALDADNVYLDNGMSADNVADALSDLSDSVGADRVNYMFYADLRDFNHWMLHGYNNDSNISPAVMAEPGKIVSLASKATNIGIYNWDIMLNGVTVYTVNFINSNKEIVSGLDIPFEAGDEISVYIGQGTNKATDPNVIITTQVNAGFPAYGNTLSTLFNPTNGNYVEIADSPELSTSSMTGSVWMKILSPTVRYGILSKSNTLIGDNTARAYRLETLASGKFRVYVWGVTGVKEFIVPASYGLSDGTWRHFAFTYDELSDTLTLYVDSVEVVPEIINDNVLVGGVQDTSQHLDIASFENGVGDHVKLTNGHLEEISLWDRALTAGEVAAIYNSGSPNRLSDLAFYDAIVAWWKMGDGDNATTMFDSSPNNNHGTPTNMVLADYVQDVP